MPGDASAYAALGLDPGADLAAIEQAYRRLIKQHHPDRDGGDSARAAEINRAYREIKAARAYRDPLELHARSEQRPRGRGWLIAALLVAIGAGALFVLQGSLASVTRPARLTFRHALPRSTAKDVMDAPLHLSAIQRSVEKASLIARTRDEFALAAESNFCHRKLRGAPSLTQFDRCAAFDDAVILIQDRDPLRDRGPFSELTVTGRLWSAGSSLSDDSLAIDGRLDRIRLRVELALAPDDSEQPASAEPKLAQLPPAGRKRR